MIVYKLAGIFGLLIIILGNIFTLKDTLRKKYSYPLFLIGGLGLLAYSINIKDMIFIVVQSVFILISLIEIIIVNQKK